MSGSNGNEGVVADADGYTMAAQRSSSSIYSQRPLLPVVTLPKYAAGHSGTHTSVNSSAPEAPVSPSASTHVTAAPRSNSNATTHTPTLGSQSQLSQSHSHSFPSIIPSIEEQSCASLVPIRHTPDRSTHSIVSSAASTPFNMDKPKDGSKKRKPARSDTTADKKQKLDASGKPKRISKPKAEKQTKGSDFPDHVWMQILECAPPRFLGKMRLVSHRFKAIVDNFDSIYVNSRLANFGSDMPAPPEGISERQFNNLLQGKGCQNPGCTDKLTTRTHWSWYKRWCMTCWKKKIIRDDRLQKLHAHEYTRPTLAMILECIPVGMQDSFVKPHDFVLEDGSPRQRGAPRLYKVYLQEDVDQILKEYDALTPPPYKEDPNHTPAEKAAAQAAHQDLMNELPEKRNAFIAERKAKNDEHMAKVLKIEQGIKSRREVIREPNSENRNARKRLFSRRAAEELPHIPEEFVKTCEPFKAATRVFRDPGSERGWQLLKPKIEKAFATDPNAHDRHLRIDAVAHEGSDREGSNNATASPACAWGLDGADDRDHSSHSTMMATQYHSSQAQGRAASSIASQMHMPPQNHLSAQASFPRRVGPTNNPHSTGNVLSASVVFPYPQYMTPPPDRTVSGGSGYGVHRSSGLTHNLSIGGFQGTGTNTVNRPSTLGENSGLGRGVTASTTGLTSNHLNIASGLSGPPHRVAHSDTTGPHRMMASNARSSSQDSMSINAGSGAHRITMASNNFGPDRGSASRPMGVNGRDMGLNDRKFNGDSRASGNSSSRGISAPDHYPVNHMGSASNRPSLPGQNAGVGHYSFPNGMQTMTNTNIMGGRQSANGLHSFMGQNTMSAPYNTNFTNPSHHTDRLSIQHLITQPTQNTHPTNPYGDFSRAFH
ncbi:hypothetical protein PVAG01_01776 [Phlyctema vagabunda]|uniref:F-box domain-containing protein n=1 Tax=Phlyctema vagabunda TaxID=108571 RepID=A0ABR4PY31_9HELO